jgi:hypothetical protein
VHDGIRQRHGDGQIAPKPEIYSLRVKIAVIARRFLPKQSLGFQRIASLRNARNDTVKIILNEYSKKTNRNQENL